ncbi:MAG: MarC family protein [Chloroherpetonaceae bacterium]|nr:MarC family protein [Chloroherpetonaceae bacterium]MDW8437217.1 MarC family protein [Chloroherpetonaceae bacterium]
MFLLADESASFFSLEKFFLTFIPLFVAIDAPGALPIYIGLTQSFPEDKRRRLTTQAILTAFAIAIVIMIGGQQIFGFLGISISDFRIAGGLILLLIAVRDLAQSGADESKQPADPENISIVPIGIPLIAGPAVLTTLLILHDAYGFLMTTLSLVLNLVIVFLLFYFSDYVRKLMGPNGAKAIAKVASLFMAAIAVMMIRVGILDIVAQLK